MFNPTPHQLHSEPYPPMFAPRAENTDFCNQLVQLNASRRAHAVLYHLSMSNYLIQ
jgi:hypothetical protein